MNHRAGGSQNGRASRSNRGSESSDLNDMKALAAAASRPAPVPTLQERGPELSGMIGGGRHSVVGARIDDRAPLSALSAGLSWTWLAAGCAAVLVPGLIGVWILARSSPAAAERTSVAVVAPAAAPVAVAEPPAPPVQIEPMARLPAMVPDTEPAAPAARGPVHYYRHRRYRGASPAALAAMAAASATGANTGAAGAAAAPAATAADQAPADSPEGADNTAAAQGETPAAEKPKKAVEAAAPEEATGAAPKTLKELRSALARLQNRVVACHQRFQVDGVADVRVAVNPSGTVESASLAGEFEGTPTGDCIVRLVSAASFPSFDGTESVKVSHSFSLE
jgi:cytochrome c556